MTAKSWNVYLNHVKIGKQQKSELHVHYQTVKNEQIRFF